MSEARVELRPTIDRSWLEHAAAIDPITHAYSLWNLDHHPDRIAFTSAVRDDTTVGYLLFWYGRPARPEAHWFGPRAESTALLDALPRPPFVAVVPPDIAPLVTEVRGAAESHAALSLIRDRTVPGLGPPETDARRLTRDDRPAIGAWARRTSDPVVAEYATADPGAEQLWGVFDRETIVGIGAAAVRLPKIWVVAGVFVDPSARRRGVGRAVVTAIASAASAAGADVGLFVREDAPDARALYGALGFREVGRRLWLDYRLGAGPT